MSKCEKPIVAISLCKTSENKHKLKFLPQEYGVNLRELRLKYGQDNVFLLPCGSCDPCRDNYAKEWSVRCALESLYHKFNYFITLTYNEIHLKKARYKDLKYFFDDMKRLDKNFKFFACEEYGEISGRLHYHAIIFTDLDFNLYDCVKKGAFYYYHSKILDNYWKYGIHDISFFDFKCSGYVAKYTSKQSKVHMSKNIGKQYFLDHKQEIIDNGFKIYEKFGNSSYVNCPRYFIQWFDELDCNIDEFKNYLKALNRSLINNGLYDHGYKDEEELLFSDFSLQKDKRKRGRLRNELS